MGKKRKQVPELERMVREKRKKYVRYEEGAQLYSMGLHTFQQLTQSLMISILNSHIPVKAPARKVTLDEKKLTKYFSQDYSAEDMEKVIESLLEKWKQEQEEM